MSEPVKDYPPYLDYPKPRKKQTNADRIRQMTDEELAALLANEACPTKESIGSIKRCKRCKEFYHFCDSCWLDWLKQEVSE